MNDSGFLQLQCPGLNSDVFHSLANTFFGVVPNAPTITGMIDTFISYSFLSSLAKSWYFSTSFVFTFVSRGTAKSTIWHIFFTLSMIIISGRIIIIIINQPGQDCQTIMHVHAILS